MSWFTWSSSAAKSPQQEAPPSGTPQASVQEESPLRPNITQAPKQSRRSQEAEAQADAELNAFIKSFANTNVVSSETSDGATSSLSRSTAYSRNQPDGSINISPQALYPRQMSCRQAFDEAFYCQSIVGNFQKIYRYGEFRDCKEEWNAFWFCMRTQTLDAESKQAEIRTYYEQRDQRRKERFRSSEDVWEMRTTPVKRAFHKDPDAVGDHVQLAE